MNIVILVGYYFAFDEVILYLSLLLVNIAVSLSFLSALFEARMATSLS